MASIQSRFSPFNTLSALLVFAFAISISAPSQTLQPVYTFQYPLQEPDGLLPDGHGGFYGEVFDEDGGQIYEVDRAGHERTIFVFNVTDGYEPNPQMVLDSAGNLYGTTVGGGAYGNGVLFKIDTTGVETVLHDFQGIAVGDGARPPAGPIIDHDGNLYGTTQAGGVRCRYEGYFTKAGCGTVYKIGPDGTETIVHRFHGADGFSPDAPLVRDTTGNFYGTTSIGGTYGQGEVFKITSDGVFSVFYGLTPSDGSSPQSGVVLDASGNLYGTTYLDPVGACGSVFRLSPTGEETLRYFFNDDRSEGCEGPTSGDVTVDSVGNIYGATTQGGDYANGVIFKIDQSGNETVLYSFTGNADGGWPDSTLLRDSQGDLYGTALFGGSREGQCQQFGCGVIFKLTP